MKVLSRMIDLPASSRSRETESMHHLRRCAFAANKEPVR